MTLPAGPEVPRAGNPLDAVPDMRATAKWTVAAFGAVGAALLGAVPPAAFGKIDTVGGVLLAGSGLLLALAGVGWAIWHTADALTPPVTVLSTIEELPELKAQVDASPRSFFGEFGGSVTELGAARRLHAAAEANFEAALPGESDPARRSAIEQALTAARANASQALALQTRLLEFAHAWQVRAALRRAQVQAAVGAGVTVLGVVLLLGAAVHLPAGTSRPAPSASVSSHP
ncbi:hypothetical protein [Actinoplanes sp. CA-252034]|uniref:hypothetical protein n=1 Tax=Actinoplanes sp. CA-252034 TaxID=3239906 RepID=UPI003D990D88